MHRMSLIFLLLNQTGYIIAQTQLNQWIANPGMSIPNTMSVVATGSNLSYQWFSNTINSTVNGTLISAATNASFTPSETVGVLYYFVLIHGDCGSDVTSAIVQVDLGQNFIWNGSQSTDWNTALNWSPEGVPPETAHIYIPNGTNDPQLAILTIDCGGSVTLAPGGRLTVSESIHNNGSLNIDDGATLVQVGTEIHTGIGTYHVKQKITGSGGATPNGRFWYVGSPMSNSVSSDYNAETSSILKFFNEPTGAWEEINDATTLINVGKGYFVQTGSIDTLEFIGGQLNNGNYTFPLTRTGTTNFYRGFNLVSNPYASYLDFDAVTKTNILPSIWYRTSDLTQTMVFDTYNSELGVGTSLGGEVVTQFIPPMQSFWVKIPTGFTTGSIGLSNSMRSHYVSGFEGLKSTSQNFPVFLRFNLEDGPKKDQLILLMGQQMSASVDEFDTEKMMISGYPQLYTNVESMKLVINSLPYSKSKVIVPITLNLPISKSYVFQTEEIQVEDGLVLLEDKQEQVFQDLSINPCYGFYSNSGVISNRFFIHMNLPNGIYSSTSLLSTLLVDNSQQIVPFEIYETNDQEIQISLLDTLIGICQLHVFDASGRLVKSKSLIDMETKIQLAEGSGFYFVQLEMNHQIFRKKIIIAQK